MTELQKLTSNLAESKRIYEEMKQEVEKLRQRKHQLQNEMSRLNTNIENTQTKILAHNMRITEQNEEEIINFNTIKMKKSLVIQGQELYKPKFSNDNNWIALIINRESPKLNIWNLKKQQTIECLTVDKIYDFLFCPDNKHICCFSTVDNMVYVWNFIDNKIVSEFKIEERIFFEQAVTPDNKYLIYLTRHDSSRIFIKSLWTDEEDIILNFEDGTLDRAYCFDDTNLIVVYRYGLCTPRFRIWNFKTNKYSEIVELPEYDSIRVIPHQKMILSMNSYFHQIKPIKLILKYTNDNTPILNLEYLSTIHLTNCLRYTPFVTGDQKYLFSLNRNNFYCKDVKINEEIEHEMKIDNFSFSFDEKYMFSQDSITNSYKIWEVELV